MAYSVKVKAGQYARLIRNNTSLLSPNPRTINYLRYKMTKPAETMDLSRVSPVFITYFITNRCNLACSFCMVGNVLNPKDWRGREATVESTERLFGQPIAKRSIYVMLSGGEPTINRDVVEIVQTLKRQGRMVAMTTNGHYLGSKADDLISAGIDSINISLYPDNFEKAREVLPAVSKRVFTKICKVLLRPMLENTGEIEDAVAMARDGGASGIYLANVFPSPNAPTAADPNIIYDTDEVLYQQVKERINAKFDGFQIYWPAMASRLSKPQKRCRMPWYFATFDPLGNLGMCCNSANCTQGNVFNQLPSEVMNTDEWVDVRRGLLGNGPVHKQCESCYMMNDPFGSDV